MSVRQWGAQKLARADESEGGEERVVNPPGRIEDINPVEVSIVPMGVTPGMFALRRSHKPTAAELAELKAAGLPAPAQEAQSLGEMVRSAAAAAVEALIPSLAKLIRNQGEDTSMSTIQPAGQPQQTPPAAPVEPTQPVEDAAAAAAATHAVEPTVEGEPVTDGEPVAEGSEAPADQPAEAMVRAVATAVFNELIKSFESKFQAQEEKTAKLERSYSELSGTVTSQASEMKRAFDGFRPGGQANLDQDPTPDTTTTGGAASGKYDFDWN